MSKKLVIDHHALAKIRDAGIRSFHETKHLPDNSGDTSVFLVLQGLHMYLVSQGIEPQFTIKPVKEENDTTPIDDL